MLNFSSIPTWRDESMLHFYKAKIAFIILQSTSRPKGSLVAEKRMVIARPDHSEAQAALEKYRATAGQSLDLFWPLISLTWITAVHNPWFKGAAITVMLVFAIRAGYRFIRRNRIHQEYQAFVRNGDIIQLDPLMVEIWDELRGEYDITLSRQERNERLRDLFSAATDLKQTLAHYHQLEGEEELEEAQLEGEARIRARLKPEILALQERQRVERELAQDALPSIEGGVTENEVADELAALRKRRQQTETDEES